VNCAIQKNTINSKASQTEAVVRIVEESNDTLVPARAKIACLAIAYEYFDNLLEYWEHRDYARQIYLRINNCFPKQDTQTVLHIEELRPLSDINTEWDLQSEISQDRIARDGASLLREEWWSRRLQERIDRVRADTEIDWDTPRA